jgi:hypothetical protein
VTEYKDQQTAAGQGIAYRLRSAKRVEPPKEEGAEKPQSKRLKGKTAEKASAPVSENIAPSTSQVTSTLTYSSKPPIKEITGDEITSMLEKFEKNLGGWKILSSHTQSTEKSSSTDTSAQNIPSAEQNAWNKRVDDVVNKINAGFIAAYTDDTTTAYSVNKEPVGMLIMTNAEIPYVTQMATHPGQTGAGGALIEEAVNKSVSWGAEGKLRLKPENKDLDPVYEAWGFKRVPTGMELDPNGNDEWIRQDGKWRLAKYKDKQYLTGFGKQDPPEPTEQQ